MQKMSVCQYYLRGNCRFGDRCRLPHVNNQNAPSQHYPRPPRAQINPIYRYQAPQIANQNRNVENPTASAARTSKYPEVFKWVIANFANKEKALDILGELQREAKVWKVSDHLWRFTSRSLFPGGQPLQEWNDQSFEEIQWAYRSMVKENKEHVYKKAYYDYIANIERQLVGLEKLRIDTLESLKGHINQYIASDYKPSKTLPTDIEMKDVNDNTPPSFLPQTQSTNYTPDDQLLEDERAAFQSDFFEFGHIPVHAPSEQLC